MMIGKTAFDSSNDKTITCYAVEVPSVYGFVRDTLRCDSVFFFAPRWENGQLDNFDGKLVPLSYIPVQDRASIKMAVSDYDGDSLADMSLYVYSGNTLYVRIRYARDGFQTLRELQY